MQIPDKHNSFVPSVAILNRIKKKFNFNDKYFDRDFITKGGCEAYPLLKKGWLLRYRMVTHPNRELKTTMTLITKQGKITDETQIHDLLNQDGVILCRVDTSRKLDAFELACGISRRGLKPIISLRGTRYSVNGFPGHLDYVEYEKNGETKKDLILISDGKLNSIYARTNLDFILNRSMTRKIPIVNGRRESAIMTYLRHVKPELYLTLGGKNTNIDLSQTELTELIEQLPDKGKWYPLGDILAASRGELILE